MDIFDEYFSIFGSYPPPGEGLNYELVRKAIKERRKIVLKTENTAFDEYPYELQK